ncbi:MAG: TetR/AcrR family transcriptional regulator [Ruminiclostridium sp.]|nr:TetR/AcrR family transcriptional regulator [Ruminiclostridium sp.]
MEERQTAVSEPVRKKRNGRRPNPPNESVAGRNVSAGRSYLGTIPETRKMLLEKGYEVFLKFGIEGVSMNEVAKAAGFGVATLYRYFDKKQGFVVEISTMKWKEFTDNNRKRRPHANFEGMTAAEIFEFYLDSFLRLYRDHKDLLKFNQMFNIYVEAEGMDAAALKPYNDMINSLEERFHVIYERALIDKTVRTDTPESEIFSTTLHLMLAAVTRYAGGLVYMPKGFDDIRELETQKQMLLLLYKAA